MPSMHGDDGPMRFLVKDVHCVDDEGFKQKAAGSAEGGGVMFAVSGNPVTPRAYAEHSQRQAVFGNDKGSCELASHSKKQ